MALPNFCTATVVYGYPHKQTIIPITVPIGATAIQAIEQSGILAIWPEINLDTLSIGIFSKKVKPETLVKDGDQIELYRPLKIDPKEARKLRASRKTK